MRIAHIFWSFTVGGAETMLVDIMNQQINKANITLIIINNEFSEKLLKELDPRISIKLIKRKPKSFSPSKFIKLNLLLLNRRHDIIHCHNYSLSKVLLPAILKRSILTVHGFNRPLTNRNKYRKVVAISNSIFQDLHFKGVRNLSLIHNGILTELIKEKKEFNETIQIVCVGRLEHSVKGQDILINSFALLKQYYPSVKLNLIGTGSSYKYLKNLTNQLLLTDDVVFHGAVSRSDLYHNLSSFDILVQPSIHEGFGLSVAEAMIARVPVLISNASGLIEITNFGKLAKVVSDQTEEEYFNAMRDIINSIKNNIDETRRQLEDAASYVLDNFSLINTCLEYEKLYKTI